MPKNSDMNIAIILGSVREGRRTEQVCLYLQEELNREVGVEAHLMDLASYELPILTDRWAEQDPPPRDLATFSAQLKAADGIILASPEYHGSYTGVLKNALDHFWKEFKRKPMGVVATGSGQYGGINASLHMQQLILHLGGYPLPYKLLVPHVNRAFDEEGIPLTEGLIKTTRNFIQEFMWFVGAIAKAKQPV